jgi:hypothetical protein
VVKRVSIFKQTLNTRKKGEERIMVKRVSIFKQTLNTRKKEEERIMRKRERESSEWKENKT